MRPDAKVGQKRGLVAPTALAGAQSFADFSRGCRLTPTQKKISRDQPGVASIGKQDHEQPERDGHGKPDQQPPLPAKGPGHELHQDRHDAPIAMNSQSPLVTTILLAQTPAERTGIGALEGLAGGLAGANLAGGANLLRGSIGSGLGRMFGPRQGTPPPPAAIPPTPLAPALSWSWLCTPICSPCRASSLGRAAGVRASTSRSRPFLFLLIDAATTIIAPRGADGSPINHRLRSALRGTDPSRAAPDLDSAGRFQLLAVEAEGLQLLLDHALN